MLIEKPAVAKEDIVAIKLITGEEILAKVVEVGTNGLTITKPLTLVLTGGQSGQGMVAMAPFVLGMPDDAKLALDNSKILVMGKARSDAAAQYRQLTSNIQVASSLPSGLAL